jgi:hypothetical protein
MTDPIIDLPPRIQGTGPHGAITAEDIARSRGQATAGGGGITSAARMAATTGPGGRPPATLEPMAFPWGGGGPLSGPGGPTIEVDRYSLNPSSTTSSSSPPPTVWAPANLHRRCSEAGPATFP